MFLRRSALENRIGQRRTEAPVLFDALRGPVGTDNLLAEGTAPNLLGVCLEKAFELDRRPETVDHPIL